MNFFFFRLMLSLIVAFFNDIEVDDMTVMSRSHVSVTNVLHIMCSYLYTCTHVHCTALLHVTFPLIADSHKLRIHITIIMLHRLFVGSSDCHHHHHHHRHRHRRRPRWQIRHVCTKYICMYLCMYVYVKNQNCFYGCVSRFERVTSTIHRAVAEEEKNR